MNHELFDYLDDVEELENLITKEGEAASYAVMKITAECL